MRRLSFRPSLTIKGRHRHGLRGLAGKPTHPPLTDMVIGPYVFVAIFDAISFFGSGQPWARDFYRAASFLLIGAAGFSVFTALTGYLDWLKSTQPGSQVRRTASAHGWTMVTVTVLVLGDLAYRWFSAWGQDATPWPALVLSAAAAGLVVLGSTMGGTLVYDFGFHVQNSKDHPVWHPSQRDLMPDEPQFPGGHGG